MSVTITTGTGRRRGRTCRKQCFSTDWGTSWDTLHYEHSNDMDMEINLYAPCERVSLCFISASK